jgi:hypothetical protein
MIHKVSSDIVVMKIGDDESFSDHMVRKLD